MKKIISLVLVIAMIMSFATVSSAATVKNSKIVTITGKVENVEEKA